MRLLRHVGRAEEGFGLSSSDFRLRGFCRVLCGRLSNGKACRTTSEEANAPELLLADHLPQVLDDELPGAQRLFCADAPPFALCTEALQTLDPVVFLDALVVTVVATRTSAGGALRKAHPNKVAIKAINWFSRLRPLI